MDIGAIVFLVIIVVILFWLISIYNGLVRGRNAFKNAFSQIDVQLQRRYDLIPNLVETAKGYIKHERETLEAVIQARNGAQQASRSAAAHPEDGAAIGALGAAEGILGATLGRFFALQESYPERWLLGTHQGAVQARQLDYYLDEYTFRFNRRTSRSRGLLFYRLLEQAVATEPVTYRDILRPTPPCSN